MNIFANYGMTNYQMGFQSKKNFAKVVEKQVTEAAPKTNNFVEKLTKYKSANGEPILSQIEAEKLVKNCRFIPNYESEIEKVLKNPKEVDIIMQGKNRGYGVWLAIKEPLQH